MLWLHIRAARLSLQVKSASLIGKILIFVSILILSTALLLIFPGKDRLFLLVSGNREIYQNLPVLWSQDPLKIHVIDVGQGDATLIQYQGKAILIDVGPRESAAKLIRYLRDLGLSRLDLLILTHPHDDHIGGAPELLDAIPVAQLLAAHEAAGSMLQTAILQRARDLKIPFIHPYRGMRIALRDLSMTCLHPLPVAYSNVNNYSSVWSLTFRDQQFLFLADLENDEIGHLSLSAMDFVRSGHHGSITSSSNVLFSKLKPQVVAISCGQGNPFGHPSKEVLKMLDQADIPYFRTDRSGTVVLSSNGQRLSRVH